MLLALNFKDDAWVKFEGDKKFHCLEIEYGRMNIYLYKLCSDHDYRFGNLYEMRRDVEANQKCSKCYQIWLQLRDRIMSESREDNNE